MLDGVDTYTERRFGGEFQAGTSGPQHSWDHTDAVELGWVYGALWRVHSKLRTPS